MNLGFFFIAALCAFLLAVKLYIIQSRRRRGVNVGLTGRVFGGVEYWSGRVFARERGAFGRGQGFGNAGDNSGGGIDVEQQRGADGVERGEVVSGGGLGVGLPGHAKGGGALGGAGEFSSKQGKNALHSNGLSVGKARRRVIVSPMWARFDRPTCLRQRVIDGAGIQAGQKNSQRSRGA